DREDPFLHARGARALEPAGTGAARRHANDLDGLAVDRVEERLEVRPFARDKNGDPERHGQAGACAGSLRTGYGPPEVSSAPESISSSTRARMSARRMCDEL